MCDGGNLEATLKCAKSPFPLSKLLFCTEKIYTEKIRIDDHLRFDLIAQKDVASEASFIVFGCQQDNNTTFSRHLSA